MHEGHRDRMRSRIANDGLDSLQPHEVLEYLLYAFVPRKDTNELAHALIEKYGNLANVFAAEPVDLETVPDMTANAARFLTILPSLFKLYSADLNAKKPRLITRGDVVRYLSPLFLGDKVESFYLLCLDAHNNVLKLERINSGIPAEVKIDARKVVEIALNNRAVSVIFAHNHPSGNTAPSRDDLELTRAVAVALELVKVKLVDHFIFGDAGYYSFSENGLVNVIGRDIDRFLKEGLRY